MKQRLLMLVIAGVLATMSFFLTDMMVQTKLKEVAVVAAKRPIKANEMLTTDNLEVIKLGSAGLHPLAVKGLKQVLGQRTSVDLIKGQVLLTPQVQATIKPTSIYYQLTPEERVMAVHTDLVRSVGGTIKPGDWVDVVAVTETSQQAVQSRTILRRVRVIDVRTEEALSIADDQQQEEIIDTGNAKVPGAVLLALTAGQVEAVAAYDHVGKIVLTLHPEHSTPVETGGYLIAATQFSSEGGQ